jgi:hypothetical protein
MLPPNNINTGYLICLLNSKLIKFYLKQIANTSGVGTTRWINIYVKEFPIVLCGNLKQNEISVLEKIITLNLNNFNSLKIKFQNYLKQKFSLEKLSKKLQNWHELEFGDFIKELNKAIKVTNKLREKAATIDFGDPSGMKEITPFETILELTKKDEFEWLDLFEENKQKAQDLQTQMNQTDKEIDAMVYELYGLTEDEIAIVENS